MKVAVVGAAGQLGRALVGAAPSGVEVVSFDRAALDITSKPTTRRVIRESGAQMILNAAAYTAVDMAETEAKLAHAINRDGVYNLRNAASFVGAKLVHVSTDFVFDGAASSPYAPDAATNPLSLYGMSKQIGEIAAGSDALIVRTSWVYAAQGRNFVHTMLRLMRERGEVRVVADQVGAPTWATGLAQAIWALALQRRTGIWHHTDSGVASWYDFAMAIAEEALALGLLEQEAKVIPIRTTDYPTPARRPAYSVLDCKATAEALGSPAPHWRANLRQMLAEVKAHG